MCGSQRPLEGADSGVSPVPLLTLLDDDANIQCGHWIERDDQQGFCVRECGHDGRCQPPEYEVES